MRQERWPLVLQTHEGQETTTEATVTIWTKRDAMQRAAIGGGIVAAIAVLMLPIPIVHFGSIPILLFGAPIVSTVIFRMYKNGHDVQANAACPQCQATWSLRMSGDYWPAQRMCPNCRSVLNIERGT